MTDRQIQVHAHQGLWPPGWPMGLTFFRLLLLPVFLWTILADAEGPGLPYHWLSVAVFAVMAITDKLDGYLARRLNQTSKLGAILDPLADKLLIACSVIVLNFDWIAPKHFRIPGWVVVAVYGKDVVIAVGAVVLLGLVGKVTIHARPLGKISTVIQLSMVLAVLVAPPEAAGWFGFWVVFVRGLWVASAVVAAGACVDYVIQGWMQYVLARGERKGAGEP
jgi:CDP-diacylglycerol--glycerol-3-phosphate 3-phosphatidyltransferase